MIINIFLVSRLLNNITLLNNDVYRVTVKKLKNKMFTSTLAAFTLPEIYRKEER